MKKLIVLLSTILVLSPTDLTAETMNHIRINQLGYLTQSVKTAVFVSRDNTEVDSFELYDALTDKPVYMSYNVRGYDSYAAFTNAERLSFSDLTKPGAYYIVAGGARSPSFRVGDDVYDGTADFLLRYMRHGAARDGLPPMPEQVAQLLSRCFHTDPEERPSAGDIADELQAIRDQDLP